MNSDFQFLLYQSTDGDVSVNAFIKDETIWLTQSGMAELFGCSTDNVSLHLRNIYAEQELDEGATSEEFSVVQQEGTRRVQRKKKFYILDAIISEYDGYNKTQKITSDFDREVKKLMVRGGKVDEQN